MTEAVQPSEGWGVLHLFYTVDRQAGGEAGAAKRILDAVAAFEADGHQVLLSCVLGHKADLGVMALGPDLARIQAFEAELAGVSAIRPVYSYLSLTELSEYRSTEDEERARLSSHTEGLTPEAVEQRIEAWKTRMAKYTEDKLHPQLPRKKLICFYPMSKRRSGDANWYTLSFEDRRRLMGGHARVGMSYAGRILQLVTGSFAFDDWEWGVTLLADDPVALKEILYEMRFDEVSALYGEFGPFLVGLLYEPAEALARLGVS
jgi:chlorite dismutase